MIASERSQNIIVVITIITAIISAGMLTANSSYYGGTYSLAGRMDVSLVDIEIRYLDYTNESVNPKITLFFNLKANSELEGNVRITFMGASVYLNDDILSYTSFAYTPPLAAQYVHPGFNQTYGLFNFAISNDREAVLQANSTDTWNWEVEFRYSFIVFDERGTITWRYLYFNSTSTTVI